MAIKDIIVPHAKGDLGSPTNWSNPEQYVIFATDACSDLADKALRFADIPFKRLVGSYKGTSEDAWIINARHWDAFKGWDGLVKQESILHLGPFEHGGHAATLYFNKPEQSGWADKFIGQFRQTTKVYALKQEAWTFDPEQNAWFIAE